MNTIRKHLAALLFVLPLLICGCAANDIVHDSDEDGAANVVRFVLVKGTKGELINTSGSDVVFSSKLSCFWVSAWNIPSTGSATVFIPDNTSDAGCVAGDATNGYYQKVMYRTEDDKGVTYDTPFWTTVGSGTGSNPVDDEYLWKNGQTKSFLAYANLPASGASVATASTGQTLTYTTVSSVADQKDILLGYYTGTAGTTSPATKGVALMRFKHALSAVEFAVGEIPEDEKITGMTLSGLGKSGSVTMSTGGVFGSWTVADFTQSLSQSATDGFTPDSDTQVIGEPFLLIPQVTETHNVTLTVNFLSGTSASVTITEDTWDKGSHYIYTINHQGGEDILLSMKLVDWDETEVPLDI